MDREERVVGLVNGNAGGLKVPLRALFVTRLKAKGGGGTPRLALMNSGSLCCLLAGDVISLDYNSKQSLYNNYNISLCILVYI